LGQKNKGKKGVAGGEGKPNKKRGTCDKGTETVTGLKGKKKTNRCKVNRGEGVIRVFGGGEHNSLSAGDVTMPKRSRQWE